MIANTLQLLVGQGAGYGILETALNQLGATEPQIKREDAPIDDLVEGLPVVLGIAGVLVEENSPSIPLSTFLTETCLRFAYPGIEPIANWSRAEIIKKVRDKFGSHLDKSPPRWLQDLRFYPIAGSDAVTFLLWSTGEAILTATTQLLRDHGVEIDPYAPADRYLDGMELGVGLVLQTSDTLDVRAKIGCKKGTTRRRVIIGARFGNQPFIFGLTAAGKLAFSLGEPGSSLLTLKTTFLATPG